MEHCGYRPVEFLPLVSLVEVLRMFRTLELKNPWSTTQIIRDLQLVCKPLVYDRLPATSFVNLTSKNLSQNPSGIYTLQTEVDIQDHQGREESVEVYLVVGGETLPTQDPLNPNLWVQLQTTSRLR